MEVLVGSYMIPLYIVIISKFILLLIALESGLVFTVDFGSFCLSRLDVYIHDYLLKRKLHASAKAFMTEGKVATDPVGNVVN